MLLVALPRKQERWKATATEVTNFSASKLLVFVRLACFVRLQRRVVELTACLQQILGGYGRSATS